jgi:hypothetical protein
MKDVQTGVQIVIRVSPFRPLSLFRAAVYGGPNSS